MPRESAQRADILILMNCPQSFAPFVITMNTGNINQTNIMSKLIAVLTTIAATFTAMTIVQAAPEKQAMQTEIPKPLKSGHAAVNDLNYYYAIYGKGEPLLLLHGGLFHTEMFGLTLTRLAQNRQVIGVDLQG